MGFLCDRVQGDYMSNMITGWREYGRFESQNWAYWCSSSEYAR